MEALPIVLDDYDDNDDNNDDKVDNKNNDDDDGGDDAEDDDEENDNGANSAGRSPLIARQLPAAATNPALLPYSTNSTILHTSIFYLFENNSIFYFIWTYQILNNCNLDT